MKEIKFRFWEKNFYSMRTWEQSYDSDNLKFLFADDNIAPMQYTGLRDRNGKEIYEGDVVEFNNNNYELTAGHRNDEIVIAEVEYSCGAWGLKEANGQLHDLYIVLVNDEEAEVIGNIYENPELLPITGKFDKED